MNTNPEKFLNKVCRVTYEDAHYSYDNFDLENFVVPSPIVSIGKIRRITDELIDISPIQDEKKKHPRYSNTSKSGKRNYNHK